MSATPAADRMLSVIARLARTKSTGLPASATDDVQVSLSLRVSGPKGDPTVVVTGATVAGVELEPCGCACWEALVKAVHQDCIENAIDAAFEGEAERQREADR